MMKLLRKWLILSHRYAGIVLSLFVVLWFATGITMMYVGGMPRLTPEMRLEKLPNLDLARVGLTPAEAAEPGSSTTWPHGAALGRGPTLSLR